MSREEAISEESAGNVSMLFALRNDTCISLVGVISNEHGPCTDVNQTLERLPCTLIENPDLIPTRSTWREALPEHNSFVILLTTETESQVKKCQCKIRMPGGKPF